MKKLSKVLLVAIAILSFAITTSTAQIVVTVRPPRPRGVVVNYRPRRPSPRHIWVAEGWRVSGGRYVYRPGYWALPPRGHGRWIPGHWRDTPRRGSIWIEGHWA